MNLKVVIETTIDDFPALAGALATLNTPTPKAETSKTTAPKASEQIPGQTEMSGVMLRGSFCPEACSNRLSLITATAY